VIGKGRSSVYSAHDTRLGREVAVKRVGLATAPDEVDDARSRALREARAAARMSSSYVVGVYDVIEEADAVWLVMELVRAPNLETLVRKRGPLPAPRATAIGLGVADALAAAHAVGVLHRDVKPANVLVMAHADDGVSVKLADFGVAALRDESSLTLPGLVVGSPSYMSPEQASGEPVGPEADLWALGALLYFAVEGVPPFSAGSALATAAAVVHGAPRPHHHPGVLTPVIDALLVKDPARRPDLPAIRSALQAIAAAPEGAERVTAQSTAAVYRAGQGTTGRLPAVGRARPRRRQVALAAAAAAALLGAAASQLVGLGTDPSRSGPPAADAQPAPDPAVGPTTSEVPPESGRRTASAPAQPGEQEAPPPDQAAGASVMAVAGTNAGPSTTVAAPTTTLPDESDPPSDPPDTSGSTTTTTSVPPTTEETTPPTTAQSAG
jgi:eukaryotic-like serine/threonine-protein kinase